MKKLARLAFCILVSLLSTIAFCDMHTKLGGKVDRRKDVCTGDHQPKSFDTPEVVTSGMCEVCRDFR